MKSMFFNCYSLTSLNISHFNTENAIDLSYMFYNCTSLTTIENNFKTPQLQDIRFMFTNCEHLKELYLPTFDTKNCKKFTDAFNGCYNLTLKIDGRYFNLRRICPNYVEIIDISD